MRDVTIARNYASVLLDLGLQHGEEERYLAALRELIEALESDVRIHHFLVTPKIATADKQRALQAALGKKAPERFLRFVLVVIAKGRQRLLGEIREEYETLLDARAGRIHAQVTLAREPDPALERMIAERLSAMLGKTVEPHFVVNPAIIGGLVVRWGDRVLDGSIRRQLLSLKREMMQAGLPALPAVSA